MYILPLEPMPCPRPRIALRGRFPTAYYPAPYKKWKDEAARLLTKIRSDLGIQFTGTVKVEANFYPKHPRTSKLDAPKPDIDNYLKSLLDAMTQAEWWLDDTQVCVVLASKRWASPGVTPHISFNVTSINP